MIRMTVQSTIHHVYFNNKVYSLGKVTFNVWWAKDGHWYRFVTNCDFKEAIVDNTHLMG